VHGIFRYANTFPAALRLIKHHQNELSIFTRQQIHLEDLPSYLRENKQAEYLKTIVTI
jgi:L-iditol 2-dehydrogenase